jgi:glycosyltransferase involved in cell wall biosynthesis
MIVLYPRDASQEMIELSVIVPAYNEASDLWDMAIGLAPHLDRVVGANRWQFVIVDNGSIDDTPKIVSQIAQNWPTLPLTLHKPDYGEAMYQGLKRAEGDWAYIINVDFWDDVMVAWCWRHRGLYDFVLGSKRSDPSLNQQHKYRKLLSWGLNSVLQFVFGFVGSDTHGQKFLYLPAVRPIANQCVMRRGQFDTELTLRAMRAGLWLAEIPVPVVELRPPRNLMFVKIYRNLVDIRRLRNTMRQIPANRPVRYHRWAREDLLDHGSIQAEIFLEAAERQRKLKIQAPAP